MQFRIRVQRNIFLEEISMKRKSRCENEEKSSSRSENSIFVKHKNLGIQVEFKECTLINYYVFFGKLGAKIGLEKKKILQKMGIKL